MKHLSFWSLSAAMFAMLTVAAPADAKELTRWRTFHNPKSAVCGVGTNPDYQPNIPFEVLFLRAGHRDSFQVYMKGMITITDDLPTSGAMVLNNKVYPAQRIELERIPAYSSLLDDTYDITLTFDAHYLAEVATSPQFGIMIDNEPFAIMALEERGPAVASLARCMQQLPQ